jgi:hypothetical protein
MAKPLKSKNTPHILSFVAFNVILVYMFSTENINDIYGLLFDDWAKKGVLSVILAILAMLINSLLDRDTKATLVFLDRKNPQPGCRAFSLYASKDPRINMDALKEKCGDFPEDERGQNQLWYKLLKKHEASHSVTWAHQHWLLTRDLTAITAIFTIGSIPVYVVRDVDQSVVAIYYLIMLGVYLMCMGAARTNGISFVTSVLAEECTKQEA